MWRRPERDGATDARRVRSVHGQSPRTTLARPSSPPEGARPVTDPASDPTSEAPDPGEAAIRFRSDMTVELVKATAHDSDVVFAARVSTAGEQSLLDVDADGSRNKGLIGFLMRERHGSPFEHNSMTFYVQAPIFVFREFMRHRIASYNEESGRYRQLDPVFYVPGPGASAGAAGQAGRVRVRRGHPRAVRHSRRADRGRVHRRRTARTCGCSTPGWPGRWPAGCCRWPRTPRCT